MKLILILLFSIVTSPLVVFGSVDSKIVKIGVLSFRTPEKTMERWSQTVDSLTESIDGYTFVLLPMNYTEINPAVENKTIDFILTNTGHYIELETNEGIKGIVTLVKSIDGITTKRFGGVVFTRADRTDINSISDLKGKTFLAVRKSSLGGFLVAWEEFLQHNIDPFSDLANLTYNGLPQDDIVFKVKWGDADAGTVRTSVLEQMEKEGQIKLEDFKILNQKDTEGFPFIHSTKLYPEWPFSNLSHVDDDLAEKVMVALLNIQHNNPAAVAGNYDRWVPPLDYESVRTLFTTLNTGPYKKFNTFTFQDVVKKYLLENIIGLTIFLIAVVFLIRIVQLNKSLKKALSEVTTLQKFLPICISCKKIKDDKGYWEQVESYISKHSETEFSHGFCPECYEKEMARIENWGKDKAVDQDNS